MTLFGLSKTNEYPLHASEDRVEDDDSDYSNEDDDTNNDDENVLHEHFLSSVNFRTYEDPSLYYSWIAQLLIGTMVLKVQSLGSIY